MRSFSKFAAAAALCGTLLLVGGTIPAAAYSDVPAGAWYAQAAEYCRESGLLNGTSAGQFSPDRTVTRGMLAVVLHRMAGTPEAAEGEPFADVAEDAWYAPAIRWASATGVMGGYGAGLFGPENAITREQLAAALWRRAGCPEAQAADFTDAAAISAYARNAVDWARANQIMNGQSDGSFGPADVLTRAQLAQVLANCGRLSGKAIQVSAMDTMCQPCGVAAMPDGALLVTDRYGKVIWRVTGGKASVFAGSATVEDIYGQPMGGYYDAGLLESTFRDPWAIAPFLDGWAVSDTRNGVVRFLRTGDSKSSGHTAVTDLGIRFDHPTGLAADDSGNLYVSETFQGLIKKITPDGKVTTLVSNLSEPMGLCWADGALYVAECGGNRILRISSSGQRTVVAGSGENGNGDGPAAQAAFSGPKGVAVAADGTVYAADTDNGTVRRIRDGQVTTILSRDPQDTSALFPVSPTGLLLRGNTLYISDPFARKLLALPLA